MKKLFLALAISGVYTAVSFASGLDNDRFGEALFFGRSQGHMVVPGPQGNLVQDEYGDVKVILCAPSEWMIYIDPNRCGYSTSRGEPCTEARTSLTGPWANIFARGNHYLTHRVSGNRQVIKSIGESKYSIETMPDEEPTQIWAAERPLTEEELRRYCRR